MKAAKQIDVQDWMISEEITAIMNVLNAEEQNALFVGGCVRNVLLGKEVEDIDIATKLSPDIVMERLGAAEIKTVPTGIEHGTVTAVSGGKGFEITTLRKDVETDGRRAVVAFAEDWAEDAQRRDFTMNTLLADAQGNIYDPAGQGLADLEARRVIFVGEPEQRIAEDYLRILRFFRFHALYGEGEADENALKACEAAADKISTLSKERITQEFFKIMSVDAPAEILRLMFDHKVLGNFNFEVYDPEFMTHFCELQNRYGLAFLASRLLVLAGLDLGNVKVLEEFLLIPKVFLKDIDAIAKILDLPDLNAEQNVKVAIYKFGRITTAQALMIELIQDRVMNGFAPKAIETIQNWKIPDFPVSGDDLIKEGFETGPALGQELTKREQAWIESGFKAI